MAKIRAALATATDMGGRYTWNPISRPDYAKPIIDVTSDDAVYEERGKSRGDGTISGLSPRSRPERRQDVVASARSWVDALIADLVLWSGYRLLPVARCLPR